MTADDLEKKKAKEAKERSGNDVDVAAEKEETRRDREVLQRVVFLKDGDKAKLVHVVTGIADNTYIEIKSGLKAGDEVVSGSYAAISRQLKDGAAIKVEKPKTDTPEVK